VGDLPLMPIDYGWRTSARSLAQSLSLVGGWAGAAGGALAAVPKLTHIDFKFMDRAAQGVAVHAELTGCPALVTFVFLKHSKDESLLEFANSLRVEDVALVHLHDEGFELISHGISLSQELM
jgi:hypothetical protein